MCIEKWFPLLRDRQDVPVRRRCIRCGGEVYEDGGVFSRQLSQLCWFCAEDVYARSRL